eukprot:TRINITY_DN1687_c0_g1_i2.p2 TRINITY_DN1687_c0_g1~~TRINITY_DN1687_c0_g1_i2.p2  ORF type:complete len:270 (+),score=73.26 TRINITY_DN1687_c0_g1_i2:723-1532(+)
MLLVLGMPCDFLERRMSSSATLEVRTHVSSLFSFSPLYYEHVLNEFELHIHVRMHMLTDGAASEGDFHASLNMAATRGAQTLFFCRNNGFAISTPTSEQFKGDGIASRGFGYGIPSIRVDGNDMLAVIEVTKKARDLTIERKGPVLIEAMSYRRGHHSTSDDSSLYRSKEEIEFWEKEKNPIKRFEQYLIGKGWWTEAESESFSKEVRSKTLQLVSKAELEEKPHLSELFKDVYDEIPPNLRVQQKELVEHLKIHGDRYPSNVPWDGME